MKKHIFIISSIIILSTIINVSAFNDIIGSQTSGKTSVTEEEIYRYILKDYNGRIALFLSDNDTPEEVFEIFTSSLPEEDVALIKNGILVTEDEVKKILEDYTS